MAESKIEVSLYDAVVIHEMHHGGVLRAVEILIGTQTALCIVLKDGVLRQHGKRYPASQEILDAVAKSGGLSMK